MSNAAALFWDIGGVILTNGWGKASRIQAAKNFRFDWDDFETRHEALLPPLEEGKLGLDEYLDRALFYCQRPFTKEAFKDFILAQSASCSETLNILRRLAQSKKYILAALNNESVDLNIYRIRRFQLRDYFCAFFSSCFLGIRKPDEAIYRLVLQMTQRAPEEAIFIDDRQPNVDAARRCGMHAIHYQNPSQLERELKDLGIEL